MSDYIVVSKTKLLKELAEYPNFKHMIIRMVESSIVDVDKEYQEKTENKISIKNFIVTDTTEEDIFWNKPKVVEFDPHLFCHSTNISYKTNITSWDDSHMLKSEGRYLRTGYHDIYMKENNSISISNTGYSSIYSSLIKISEITKNKLFFEKYVKLLSKTYPSIKTYIVFWRYWVDKNINTDNKTNLSGNYYSNADTYYIIPEKKFYSHLPFMKNYSPYLVTLGERKGYKIQMYSNYSNIKDTIKWRVHSYIFENNQEFK